MSTRQVATVLAALFVEERLLDDDDASIRIWSGRLDLQVGTWQVAQRLARAVLEGQVIKYTWTRTDQAMHHTWAGDRDGVTINVIALGPRDEAPLDPLDATDEDDYLRRLIAIGLVVNE
jgi:hypothetical protein